MGSIGLRELVVIGGIGAMCALPLIAGAIALVVMLAKSGKRIETKSNR